MTISRILFHPITIIVFSVLAIMTFFSLDKSSKKTQSSSDNIKILEYEINQISEDIIDLEEKIEETESEQFKEKIVRNELLMQKPGEYILQIAENHDETNKKNDFLLVQEKSQSSTLNAWRDLLF